LQVYLRLIVSWSEKYCAAPGGVLLKKSIFGVS